MSFPYSIDTMVLWYHLNEEHVYVLFRTTKSQFALILNSFQLGYASILIFNNTVVYLGLQSFIFQAPSSKLHFRQRKNLMFFCRVLLDPCRYRCTDQGLIISLAVEKKGDDEGVFQRTKMDNLHLTFASLSSIFLIGFSGDLDTFMLSVSSSCASSRFSLACKRYFKKQFT